MTVTSERLAGALALLAEVLRTPSFPEREVERLKEERLAELLQLRAEPRGLADEHVRPVRLRAELALCTARWRRRATVERARPRRRRAVLPRRVCAGQHDADHRRRHHGRRGASARGATRSAPGAAQRYGAPPCRIVPARASAHRARRRQSGRAAVGASRRSRRRSAHCTPTTSRSSVMNAMLGGLFSSRINLNLREAHAYTYGAFSSFDWRRDAGPFAVSTAVQSDVTDAAVREILHRDRSHARGGGRPMRSSRSRRAISTACFRFASRRRRRSPMRSPASCRTDCPTTTSTATAPTFGR